MDNRLHVPASDLSHGELVTQGKFDLFLSHVTVPHSVYSVPLSGVTNLFTATGEKHQQESEVFALNKTHLGAVVDIFNVHAQS